MMILKPFKKLFPFILSVIFFLLSLSTYHQTNASVPGVNMNLENKPDPKKDGYLGVRPETDPNKLPIDRYTENKNKDSSVNELLSRDRLGDGGKNDLFYSGNEEINGVKFGN